MQTLPTDDLFTRRGELLLALFCALSLLMTGCEGTFWGKSGGPGKTAVQVAACVLVDRLPQSAGYLTAAAGVFRSFASATNLPAPADVRAALAAIPNAKLTVAQQEILWGATVLAYEVAQRTAKTPADFVSLRGALGEISGALVAAVETCGPPKPPAGAMRARAVPPPAELDEQGLYDLSKTIGKQLRP